MFGVWTTKKAERNYPFLLRLSCLGDGIYIHGFLLCANYFGDLFVIHLFWQKGSE